MIKIKNFDKLLTNWFDSHGRKDLPWQINKTPYRVWISEIMLQQTQVSTVIPYFLKFMEKFPTLESLSLANEDEVLHLWTGLGYYTRARNLLKTAKLINGKQFPSTLAELEDLPGIGRSTAGAILSIAFKKRATILDGNVKRVFTRLYGIREWPGLKSIKEKLWNIAETHTPSKRTDDYSQALMDLGATICARSQPRCFECPFKKICIAQQENIAKLIPISKPKKPLPTRKTTWLIFQDNKFVLLQKRSGLGVWKNLWSFPDLAETKSQVKKFCQQKFQLQCEQIVKYPDFTHTFSHFHWHISPLLITVKRKSLIQDNPELVWYDLTKPLTIGMPQPVKKILHQIAENLGYLI